MPSSTKEEIAESADEKKKRRAVEDVMISEILAKHGITLKGGDNSTHIKDSSDRILDKIDAQLDDVKINIPKKETASVNGEESSEIPPPVLRDSTFHDTERNTETSGLARSSSQRCYPKETEETIPLKPLSYGYKARSLNDLSYQPSHEDGNDYRRSVGKPSTARRYFGAQDKQIDENMPILSYRELVGSSTRSYISDDMSLPSSIHGNYLRSYTRQRPHWSLDSSNLSYQRDSTLPKPYAASTPYFTSALKNRNLYPKAPSHIDSKTSHHKEASSVGSYRNLHDDVALRNNVKAVKSVGSQDVDDTIPESEIVNKQEQYEWRLQKMLIEQENSFKDDDDKKQEMQDERLGVKKFPSATVANCENETMRTDDLLEKAGSFVADVLSDRESKSSRCTKSSIKSNESQTGSVAENTSLTNFYKIKDYHTVPSYNSNEVLDSKATSTSSAAACMQNDLLDNEVIMQESIVSSENHASVGSNSTNSSVQSKIVEVVAVEDNEFPILDNKKKNSTSSQSLDRSKTSSVGKNSTPRKRSSATSNFSDASDDDAYHVPNSTKKLFDSCIKELRIGFENKKDSSSIIVSSQHSASMQSDDAMDGDLDRTLTPTENVAEKDVQYFNKGVTKKDSHSNIGDSNGHIPSQDDNSNSGFSADSCNIEVRSLDDGFQSSHSSTSTLHTADVPQVLRNSLVRFSSEDRSSLEFTLHVSSTDIESLPTSDFEDNWQKRQQNRFPELDPVAIVSLKSSKMTNTEESKALSPRSKKKLTKRERMKLLLSSKYMDKSFEGKSLSLKSNSVETESFESASEATIKSDSMTTEDLINADCSGAEQAKLGGGSSPSEGSQTSRINRPNSAASFSTTQTEDFEERYRNMMVRHVAGVPLTSFDSVTIASDLDSIKTDTVHQHFMDSLNRKKGEGLGDTNDGDPGVKVGSQQGSDDERSRRLRDRFRQLKSSQDTESNSTSKSTEGKLTRSRTNSSRASRSSSCDPRSSKNRASPLISRTNDSTFTHLSNTQSTLPDYHRSSSRNSTRLQASELTSSRSRNQANDTIDKTMTDSASYYPDLSTRRHSYHSTASNPQSDQRIPATTTKVNGYHNDLDEMDAKKMSKMKEIKAAEETLEKHRINLLKLEEKLRENQAKADDARAELMVLEFKRDQARSDLEKANKDLGKVAAQMKEVDNDSMISYDEMIALIQERDELKARIRRGEASALSIQERQELERALHVSKEELFRERKLGRERMEDLEEKVEEVEHNFEIMESEKNAEISRLEAQLQKLRQDAEKKNSSQAPPTDRTRIIEAEKKQLYEQIESLKSQLQGKDAEIVSLATDGNRKREENEKLQKQASEFEAKLNEQLKLREKLISETEKQINIIKKEKEQALSSLTQEKHSVSKQNEREIENVREKTILECKLESQNEIGRLKATIENKDLEINQIRDRLREQEESTRSLGEKLRREAQDQVRTAIAKERCLLDQERDLANKREEEARKEGGEKERFRMQQDVDDARGRCKLATEQIAKLSKEIDDLRQQNRDLHQEKLEAASAAREELLQEQKKKFDQFRSDMEEQCQLEISKHRTKTRKLEEDNRKLKQEKNEAILKCKESASQADRFERTVSVDMFEECQKLSDLVQGIRTPSQSRNRGSSVSSRSSSHLVRSRPFKIDGALANLRNVCDDVRATLRDLTTEVETHKRAAQITQRELDRANQNDSKPNNGPPLQLNDLTNYSDEILRQKLALKDEELREVQRNMSTWKDSTAQRLAQKFEEELELQLDRRMTRQRNDYQRQIDRLESELNRKTVNTTSISQPTPDIRLSPPVGASSSPTQPPKSPSGSPGHTSTVKLLRHLQGRVKQLRAENDLLRSSSQLTDFDSYRVNR